MIKSFAGKTVLVTGHTGFKGSWLSLWLEALGARVVGFSLPTLPTAPSHFEMCKLGERMVDVRGDIRDLERLKAAVNEHQPAVIFHLAAQPIVMTGYDEPQMTFETNVLGTVNLLEAARGCDAVQAIIVATTDKVYKNREWVWGYREGDELGGRDPYSASKAMAELAIASYQESYFNRDGGTLLASVRAGNVIGGGDFAPYRLVPDCMNALMNNEPIALRNPRSVRPWLHVLDPLYGYLRVAERLLAGDRPCATAYNFGPMEQSGITAQTLAETLIKLWGAGEWVDVSREDAKAETNMLRLSWEKAAAQLDWRPRYAYEDALREIVTWHKAYERGDDMYIVGLEQIRHFMAFNSFNPHSH